MGRVGSWGEVCVPSSFGSDCRRARSDCGSRFGRRDDIDIGSRLRLFDHDGGADHHDRTGHHDDPRDHDVGRRGHDDRVDDNQSAGNDHVVSQAERHHDDRAAHSHVDDGVHDDDVASEAPAPAHRERRVLPVAVRYLLPGGWRVAVAPSAVPRLECRLVTPNA
jgi:hypothetical protein